MPRAKPAGVMDAENARVPWASRPRTGPPPADRSVRPPCRTSELTFLAVDTRTPYVASFDGADAGKTAHYMLRWVSTTGWPAPQNLIQVL
jgi:hypothetical protein